MACAPASHRQVQNRQLLFDAAVEFAVVLVAAAGGQNNAVGELLQEAADRVRPLARMVQEIQAEFQENLAGLGLAPGVVEQCWNIRQAQRDADARERPGLRHLV